MTTTGFFEGIVTWEQCKLGTTGQLKSGIPFPDKEQGGKKGIPFFKVSDITNVGNEKELFVSNNYVSEEQIAKNKWQPIENVPAIVFAKIGASLMLNRKRIVRRPFLIDKNTMAFSFDDSWDVDFGVSLFETIHLPKYAQAGALPSFNVSDIEKIDVNLPAKEEQKKIGSLFCHLDQAIALHQEKLDKLRLMKMGYLQELFPGNGKTVPRLRFADFGGEWEKRKLSDVAERIGDGLHGTPEYAENGNIAFINGNNLANGEIVISADTRYVTDTEQPEADKELNSRTILMSINGTIGNLAWYNGEKLMLGKSVAYIGIDKADKNFIYAYLQTRQIKRYFMSSLTGTTIKNLALTTIRDTPLYIPSCEEQLKIGIFFERLDKTIALHQNKIERLKGLKRFYLSKLFI